MASWNRWGWYVFLLVVLASVLVGVRAQDTNGLPLFTRQPSCEDTGNTNLLRLRAEVSGAESLQWMSNNVPVAGGTNLTIEFAPELTNVTAYVLIASNAAGVVPSEMVWGHACERRQFYSGVVELDSTEQLVLDGSGAPLADGEVKLHVGRTMEELYSGDGWMFPIAPLRVSDGRIARGPRTVFFRPGTRVFAQFRLQDPMMPGLEHGRSKIFEAIVETDSEPGSLNGVEPWVDRPWDCYGLTRVWVDSFVMQVGRPVQLRARVNQIPCGWPPPGINFFDNHKAIWRKNGVPLEATHPIYDTNRVVTLADAGVYELVQRDDYIIGTGRYIVSLRAPAEFRVMQVREGSVRLSIRSESTGRYRLEQSSDLIQWSLLQEGDYTNRTSVVEVPVPVSGGAKFYRLK